ncbi:transposase (plasmid) [Methylobacterium aquaticum]|uniref:Transposase n=1 Tax=Methylobacterium aquaticum TaxID=270351 RepID=A0A0C6G224_9HYPH|nr:transposase [Methylobacterium aquaticum]
MGGDQCSHVIEAHAPRILSLCEERGNIVLSGLRDALAEQGVAISTSSLSRFVTAKLHAAGAVACQCRAGTTRLPPSRRNCVRAA